MSVDARGNVAHIAHVGGTLAGAAAGVGLLCARLIRSNELEENLLQVLGLMPLEISEPPRRPRRAFRHAV